MSNPHILSPEGRQQLDDLYAATGGHFRRRRTEPSVGQELLYSRAQARNYFNKLKHNPVAEAIMYAATPSRPQTGQQQVVELANWFLAMLPMVPVRDLIGQKVLVGLSGRVASRTDTSGGGERTPKRLQSTGTQDFDLKSTEFDVALAYATIDAWTQLGQGVFEQLYMQAVRDAISNDMLQTGWTGTSAATATNIGANPLLQDLNKGWLQKIREYNGGSQYHIGTVGVPISIGASTGVYKNLDQAVQDAKLTVKKWYRGRTDLVALVSDNLVNNQEGVYYKTNGNVATEKMVLDGAIRKGYGGLPTIVPPFFPDGTILITPLSNLAIYYQDSSVRRLQRDWPSKNEIQDFNSMNMGYVVQDENATSLVENITLVS